MPCLRVMLSSAAAPARPPTTAINVNRSGTRREELLLVPAVLQKMWILRKLLYNMDDMEAMEFLLDKVKATKNNAEFFDAMRQR